jgi:ribosomal protein S18 acetylase RimI-like enzyme
VAAFSISSVDECGLPESALETLLHLVYVGGGFTDPAVADAMFRPTDVRARGHVLVAHTAAGRLLGMAIVVAGGAPACRFAGPGEAELHLLAVHPEARGTGIGGALVEEAMVVARRDRATRMILWTQPPMEAARRLYARLGFTRVPALDFARGERSFLVLARQL